MKIARYVAGLVLFVAVGAWGQTTIVMTAPKDPEVKPEQRTAAIAHYEKLRGSSREIIRQLALDLQNGASSKARLNEAMDYQQDMVDWANWCILALRDKTAEAKACVMRTDLK